MSVQRKWIVYRYSHKKERWEYWDEVYFTLECDERYVRSSLINHDGYPADIKVKEE